MGPTIPTGSEKRNGVYSGTTRYQCYLNEGAGDTCTGTREFDALMSFDEVLLDITRTNGLYRYLMLNFQRNVNTLAHTGISESLYIQWMMHSFMVH